MMKNMIIRTATANDAEELLTIYAYYVENTAITFEYDVPTLEEFTQRIENTLKKYPYLVAEKDGEILGYAYAGVFKDRAAYDWSAETTIYLKQDAVKGGLGRMLYEALEKELQKIGVLNLYASIAYPIVEDEYLTTNSADFHAHLGYEKIGEFHKCGYKFGNWYHMIWMEKFIGEHVEKPVPVRGEK
jgi:phosphinothricin acetyltransferase